MSSFCVPICALVYFNAQSNCCPIKPTNKDLSTSLPATVKPHSRDILVISALFRLVFSDKKDRCSGNYFAVLGDFLKSRLFHFTKLLAGDIKCLPLS